jgi:hypothetical protein
VVSSEI